MTRNPKITVPQGALDLYDAYAHGELSRRGFFSGLSKFAVGGMTVTTLAACIMPDYEGQQQTQAGDAEFDETELKYASPQGAGEMSGYLVKPAGATAPLGGIVVIHENRGLNPHIRISAMLRGARPKRDMSHLRLMRCIRWAAIQVMMMTDVFCSASVAAPRWCSTLWRRRKRCAIIPIVMGRCRVLASVSAGLCRT